MKSKKDTKPKETVLGAPVEILKPVMSELKEKRINYRHTTKSSIKKARLEERDCGCMPKMR